VTCPVFPLYGHPIFFSDVALSAQIISEDCKRKNTPYEHESKGKKELNCIVPFNDV
jgi:hypothetical protein